MARAMCSAWYPRLRIRYLEMVDSEFVAVDAETQARVDRSRRYAEARRRGRAGEARLSASMTPCAMIVTMAYDEDLANRIRELIASEDGYTEQKMFGGIGFMIDGHMAVGVSGEGGLMIHCSREETEGSPRQSPVHDRLRCADAR